MPKNNNVVIHLEDVMKALSECKNPNERKELCQIYTNEDYNELGKKTISKDSKVYQIINKQKNKSEETITIGRLSLAYTIAVYECNHSVSNKLKKYIHQFLDNITEKKDNELLIYKIINDKEVIKYITRFSSWEDYQIYLMSKQKNVPFSKKENNVVASPKEENNKRISYVIM